MVSNAARHIPGFMEKKRNCNFRWTLIEIAFHSASSSRSQTQTRAVREARLGRSVPSGPSEVSAKRKLLGLEEFRDCSVLRRV